jgi:phospholipid/cholesterol/gamma-HCH transport system substrate-binding protein
MIEADRRVSIWVGLLVAGVGITAALIVLFLGSAARLFGGTSRVTVCFRDVTGLNSGAAVLTSGVRIGSVARVALGGLCGARAQVELAVDGDAVVRLSADSRGQLVTMGLLGDRVVVLESGAASARLQSGSVLEGRVPPDASVVIAQAGQAFDGLTRIANRIDSALADTDIEGVLEDVAGMAHALRGLLVRVEHDATGVGPSVRNLVAATRDARNLMARLDRAATDAAQIVAHVRSGQGTLGGVIYDPAVYEDLRMITGRVRRSVILRSLARYLLRHHK